MKSLQTALALATVLIVAIGSPVRAEITPEQVRNAIDRGVRFLLGQQRDDGSWPDILDERGGVSSLCALALLSSGVEPDDPRMQNALNYLRKIRPERTYTLSLQTMVFARAEPDRDRDLIARNVKQLERFQLDEGPNKGAWSYPYRGGTSGDNSNSQFALLALHEAERAGVSASDRTWLLAKRYWESCQHADGSWGYTKNDTNGTGSMTCAGITSVAIADDRIQSLDVVVNGNHIDCCAGRPSTGQDPIDRAFVWLGKNYSVSHNPNNQLWHLYYLYGLERAGRLTARRFIPLPARAGQPDRADWYRDGADLLVHQQEGLSGFWTSRSHAENNPLIGTSFALMFLSKGRWPVLVGKLQHGPGNDWDRHRADVGNLTRYVESRWKRDMTWQVIDLRLATIDDLVQTPVLYLCGSENPLPDDPAERKALAEKLVGYLERGGFLLAEDYCGGTGFDRGFRELVKEMFPDPAYPLRLLEPEHPIWYAEEKVAADQLRPVWGIDFGCRTSVVYLPLDPPEKPRPSLSCLWELSRPGRENKYSESVQAQIGAALSLGINILAYATNRELKTKEDFFRPASKPRPTDPFERGRLTVANLRHPGGCNVAPLALNNLMEAAGTALKIRTSVRKDLLDLSDPGLFDYPLVFMHGRTAFHLTDLERKQLKEYIERGGTLLADSICASQAFSESFRREMAAIFPDRKLERIPVDDPLYSTIYGGFDLKLVSRRDPQSASGEGSPLEANVKRVPPELEGIKFGDRWGVVFSPYDLSCALEQQNSMQCRGYTREDAARIGLNVILYSLQQ